ncbi:hypothetical protein FSP39_015262 [Pinctada imbricata]|uniref:SGNH hydrolase-type esterase domain-containing protein n=1 Tax=Pinctada imbricata TaxID=66713 RepID=A0AA88XWN6_PINIB|nr:hypothetical protein FSP39_015262 [Pinctada imbricata]
MARTKVAIIGHSFVRRIKNFIEREKPDGFNLNIENVEGVKYFYKSGGLVKDMFSFLPAIKRYRPRIVFVQIGGNDIGKNNPSKIAKEIEELCCAIYSETGANVIVGSLFRRFKPRQCTEAEYEIQRCDTELQINSFSKRTSIPVNLWKHPRLGMKCLFDTADGVHLKYWSQERFYRSLRGAVLANRNSS